MIPSRKYPLKYLNFFIWSMLLSLAAILTAAVPCQANTNFTFDEKNSYESISKYFQYMEDRRQIHSVQSALKENDYAYTPVNENIINFGLTKTTYWLRTKIKYQPKKGLTKGQPWYISVRSSHQAVTNLWLFVKDNNGDYVPLTTEKFIWSENVYKTELTPNTEVTILIKQAIFGGNQTEIFLSTQSLILGQLPEMEYLYGLFFGVILAMMIYNGILFVILKDRCLVLYALYIFCVATNMLSLSGHGQWLFWSADEEIASRITHYSAMGLMVFIMAFLREYIEIKKYSEFWDNFLYSNRFVFLGVFILSLITLNELFLLIIASVSAFAIISILVCCIFTSLQGSHEARFFLYSFSPIMIVGFFWVMTNMGLFSSNLISDQWFMGSVALQILIMSYGIGQKTKYVKKELNDLPLQTNRLGSLHSANESNEQNSGLGAASPENSRSISEEYYWEFFQSTPLHIIMATFDGTLLTASQAFWQMLNKSEQTTTSTQNLFDLLSFETGYAREKFYNHLNRQQAVKKFPLLFGLNEDNPIKCLCDLSFLYDSSQGQTAIILVLYPSMLEAPLARQDTVKLKIRCVTQYITHDLSRCIKLIGSPPSEDDSTLNTLSYDQQLQIKQSHRRLWRRIDAVIQLLNPVFPSRQDRILVSWQNVSHALQHLTSLRSNAKISELEGTQINLAGPLDFHRSIFIYEKHVLEMFAVLLLSLANTSFENESNIEIFITTQETSKELKISCNLNKSLTAKEKDFAELYLTEITQVHHAQYKIHHQQNTCAFEILL